MTQTILTQARQRAQSGDTVGAIEACRVALAHQPRDVDALFLLGSLQVQQGHLAAAGEAWEAALRIAPDQPQLLLNLGTLSLNRNQPQAALTCYDRLLATHPQWDEGWNAKGNALSRLAQAAAAIPCFDRAIELNPHRADAMYSRATAWVRLGDFGTAASSYQQAVAVRADFVPAWYGLSIALAQLGRLPEAVAALDRVVALNDRFGHVLGLRLHTRMKMCDWRGHAQDLAQLATRLQTDTGICAPFEALTLWDAPALLQCCAQAYTRSKFPASIDGVAIAPRRDGKIRIGYFSADLHAHATAFLMAGLLEQHDKARFHITAYSMRPVRDAMTERLAQALDAFVDVTTLSDAQVVALVREQGLDIAVDLKGYTESSRTGLFAARLAPVQVNYLGFPGTMGADFMDYIVLDHALASPRDQQHYTEQIVYLPHSYQATDNLRAVSERTPSRLAEGLPEQGVVYACFNNNFKITPAVFSVWLRILQAVPGAVLWLLADNPQAQANLQHQAQRQGLDAARLVFAPRIAVDQHLARLRLADLFLDTMPVNAHTSASDALWVGLPVLTCKGSSFAARVGASLLQAMDLPELVTESLTDYESQAVALGRDAPRLQGLRARLLARRATAPLFNTRLFTRHLEAAYLAMHQRACDGLPPASFAVAPLPDTAHAV
jgi:predicted O-linked N-acetylglucosamine transferase (SPINDLY family)